MPSVVVPSSELRPSPTVFPSLLLFSSFGPHLFSSLHPRVILLSVAITVSPLKCRHRKPIHRCHRLRLPSIVAGTTTTPSVVVPSGELLSPPLLLFPFPRSRKPLSLSLSPSRKSLSLQPSRESLSRSHHKFRSSSLLRLWWLRRWVAVREFGN